MNYRNNKILLLIITIFISSYIACQDRLIVLFDETPSISCNVSDVVLLLDSTGSMGSAINSVKSMLTASIIPGLENSVEDLQIGIATYEDIPVGQYGNAGDLPFTVEHKVTDNFTAVQSAVNSITLGNGGDGPESYVEALYLMVTNESFGPWFSSSSCPRGTRGAMCFRQDATPIIILISDSPTHNGPGNSSPYSGVSPTPHTYSQAITALGDLDAHVLVINTSPVATTYPEMSQLATDTGGVDKDGNPIVLLINPADRTATGEAIVDIIKSYCF